MFLTIRFIRGKRKAEEQWRKSTTQKITDLGVTESLEILPLIDWYTSYKDLTGEPGISYFIKTDESSILFAVMAVNMRMAA